MSYRDRLESLRQDSPLVKQRELVKSGEDPYQHVKNRLHRTIISRLGVEVLSPAGDVARARLDERVAESLNHCLQEEPVPLTRRERDQLLRELQSDILGYGPLDRLLEDDSISEIMVNRHDDIYVERDGIIDETSIRFADEAHFRRIIDRIVSHVGRRLDEASPMVDARLPDGCRVNVIIPPLALDGPCLTIRKFKQQRLTMEDLVRLGTFSSQSARFLELCVKGGANILISGGTGSGKTTILNALSAAIPETERIVTVEDAAELKLSQKHVVRLETRQANLEGRGAVTIRDLVRNCLRMRPDRIIVGECRGNETVDMLQALNTGHDGCLTTIHSNSPRDSLRRVESLIMAAGLEIPMRAIREQMVGAFDLVVHLQRLVDGTRRVTHITEVGGLEGETITLQDLFVADPHEGEVDGHTLFGPLQPTGIKPKLLGKLASNGVRVPAIFLEEPAVDPSRQVLRNRLRGAA